MNKTEKQVATQQSEKDQSDFPSIQAVKKENGTLTVQVTEDGNARLERILASKSKLFIETVCGQLRNSVMVETTDTTEAITKGIALVNAIGPRDELETMLALQMAAVHQATMTFARQLAFVKTIPQQDSAERTLNKLTRTFCVQMETLKKYRGGEQKITVQHQHVTVNDGGQAIVGTVEQKTDRGEG